jgi:hypothetical protein
MSGYTAELVIHFDAAVPPWWQMFNPGTCRAASLAADLNPPEGLACREWYSFGYASGGITSYGVVAGVPNRVRVRLDVSSDPDWAAPLDAGDEILLFRLLINHLRTVGTCGGCDLPAAIFFTDLKLLSPDSPYGMPVATPFPDAFASWQCALSGGAPAAVFDCPTPALPSTWGRIKAFYR